MHGVSAKFSTGEFECMVCLKKFTLQKGEYIYIYIFFFFLVQEMVNSGYLHLYNICACHLESIRVSLVARVPRVGHPCFIWIFVS